MMDKNLWKPSPRYLLRKALIKDFFKGKTDLENKSILEIGYGAADTFNVYQSNNLNIYGFDFSSESTEMAKSAYEDQSLKINLFEEEGAIKKQKYNFLAAFEVLEHIESDTNQLKDWKDLLENNGEILISVPCHMKKWGPIDEWAGHYRRYEKDEILLKLQDAGFTDINIKCYGFPLTLVLDPLLNSSYKNWSNNTKEDDKIEKTKRSGRVRKKKSLVDFFVRPLFLFPFVVIQKLFANSELGSGYLISARVSN